METLFVEAVQNLIVQSPVVGLIAGVVWLLREDLKECIAHNQKTSDALLAMLKKK